ncbi:hypothetical protein LCGC14_1635870 [marine sediment metagenome]|uniref:Uncharacterized protein n=1 Tax=marine sediment metagenome TaxID=412755 RepID=A0A0F9KGU4_9ZZZZ
MKRKTSAATRKKLSRAAKGRRRRADGAFTKGGGGRKRRRNPPAKRKAAPRRAASKRAAPRRRNPSRRPRNFTDTLIEGVTATVTITAAKVATRCVPKLVGVARADNRGIAVQLASAIGISYAADFLLGPGWAGLVLAGGLQAPLEDLAVRYQIPVVSEALAPAGTVGRYAPRRVGGVGRYAPRLGPTPAQNGLRISPPPALGSYVTSPPGSGISPIGTIM